MRVDKATSLLPPIGDVTLEEKKSSPPPLPEREDFIFFHQLRD